MKKITTVLVGLALSAAANANQHDLSQRFYAGINVGGSFATLSSTGKKIQNISGMKKFSTNYVAGDIHVGKRFGMWGVELSGGLLDKVSNNIGSGAVVMKSIGYLFALDFGYYLPLNEQVSFRPTLGIGGLYSQNTITLANGAQASINAAEANFAGNDSFMGYTRAQAAALPNGKSTNSSFKLAPKAGLGLVFAVHQNVSLTAAANFIWPISNDTVKYVINANVGANYHF